MLFLKLPFAAHINDFRAFAQPFARCVWPHLGQSLVEEERHNRNA
jgi:hypothetical protein